MNAYNSDELSRLEPAYLTRYGLQEAPFSHMHQDKFMFLDAERAQRLNMLQHMCRYSNLLLIVQGEQGVGKTALMQRFIKMAEPDWQVCQISANTMLDAEQLLFQAAQGFGVNQLPQDASELQEMLYARVATFHHNNQTPILIIDDAHLLPKDALLAIFNLADAYVNDVNLLRIILFCEPQIEKIINSKDVRVLRERVTHTMEIPPFDEEATAEYLKHRMAVAGFNGSSPFMPKTIKRIVKASGGIPAKINELAHEVLDMGDNEISVEHSPDPVRVNEIQQQRQSKPVIYATLAVLLVVIVLVFQDTINRLFEDTASESEHTQTEAASSTATPLRSAEQVTKEIDLKEKIIPLAEQSSDVAPVKEQATAIAEQSTQTVTADEAEAAPPVDATTETRTETVTQTKPQAIAPLLTRLEPVQLQISKQPQTVKIHGEGFTAQSQVNIAWTGKQKTLSRGQIKRVDDKLIEVTITVGLNEDNWSVAVQNPASAESNRLEFRVVDGLIDTGYRKDKWLLSQEPNAFTMQLFGTNKQANAEQFIKEHNLKDQAGIYQHQRKNIDWYSVVYGVYPDQAAAQQASKQLPASLKKIKPWVRRLDDIQASINATRQRARNKPLKPRPTTVVAAPNRTPAASNNPPASHTQHEAWLWSQDPSGYTLQLLGARQSDSIQKFLKKYSNLNGKAVYFHTRHDARDWYTVVYGVYADREQAKQAIGRLPSELQTSSPWIRSFGSIHAELSRTE